MKDLNVYYTKNGDGCNVYLVQNHYDKSIKVIKDTLKYAKSIGLTVPHEASIQIQVLAGPKYKGVMSVEFNSKTKPTKGTLLERNSGLWDWLKY